MTVTAPTAVLVLRGEYVCLDAALKASGMAGSGGHAKSMVVSGTVAVNGSVERRRGRKLRAGDWIDAEGRRLVIGGVPVGVSAVIGDAIPQETADAAAPSGQESPREHARIPIRRE